MIIASVGGLTAAGLVTAGILAIGPPQNLVTALLLIFVAVPVAGGTGTWLGLAATSLPHRATAARLAVLGSPVLTILMLFSIDLVIAEPDSRSTQIASFIIGVGLASGLAARFSDTP